MTPGRDGKVKAAPFYCIDTSRCKDKPSGDMDGLPAVIPWQGQYRARRHADQVQALSRARVTEPGMEEDGNGTGRIRKQSAGSDSG